MERLSRLEEGSAAFTSHNKYVFKWPGVQAHFSFPRQLLNDRVIQDHSLPSLCSPSRRLGRASDFKCRGLLPTEAFTPVALACFPLPPEAAGSQLESQVHLEVHFHRKSM